MAGSEAVVATDRLWVLLDTRALHTGQSIRLSSGRASTYYFDCKPVTLGSDGAPLVGEAFLDALAQLPPVAAAGGRTVGADPIVGAMMLCAHARGQRLEGFYVRAKTKAHGTRQRIENVQPPGTAVVIVDDVVTTGASVIEAVDAAEGAGCRVVGAIALIDRLEEGGAERIRSRVPHYIAIYTRDDFPRIGESPRGRTSPTG